MHGFRHCTLCVNGYGNLAFAILILEKAGKWAWTLQPRISFLMNWAIQVCGKYISSSSSLKEEFGLDWKHKILRRSKNVPKASLTACDYQASADEHPAFQVIYTYSQVPEISKIMSFFDILSCCFAFLTPLSLVTDLFSGQLRSSLHCSVCSHYSNTFDVFCDLSLPIPKVTHAPSFRPRLNQTRSPHFFVSLLFQRSDSRAAVTLRGCLDLFSQEEKLEKENSPVCTELTLQLLCAVCCVNAGSLTLLCVL